MSKLYYTYLKENGGNRLVTYASDKPKVDICFEFCDIISINQYFGWYYGTREDWKNFPEKFDVRRKELGFEKKPVIMSEFGAAAAYGYHTFDDVKWTEEYQAKLLEIALQTFHDCPYMIGSYIWQFCDTVSDKDINKVGTLNNKGILSGYREPKLAYNSVKAKYLKFKEEVE
jgi:beta-glucuronidase